MNSSWTWKCMANDSQDPWLASIQEMKFCTVLDSLITLILLKHYIAEVLVLFHIGDFKSDITRMDAIWMAFKFHDLYHFMVVNSSGKTGNNFCKNAEYTQIKPICDWLSGSGTPIARNRTVYIIKTLKYPYWYRKMSSLRPVLEPASRGINVETGNGNTMPTVTVTSRPGRVSNAPLRWGQTGGLFYVLRIMELVVLLQILLCPLTSKSWFYYGHAMLGRTGEPISEGNKAERPFRIGHDLNASPGSRPPTAD